MNALDFILAGTLAAATPFLLAALGELVVERSGVLNLGIEGMMALAAAVAFITTYHFGHHGLGFLFAALTGVAIALLFALLALGFVANQVAAGLAVGVLGHAGVPCVACQVICRMSRVVRRIGDEYVKPTQFSNRNPN